MCLFLFRLVYSNKNLEPIQHFRYGLMLDYDYFSTFGFGFNYLWM